MFIHPAASYFFEFHSVGDRQMEVPLYCLRDHPMFKNMFGCWDYSELDTRRLHLDLSGVRTNDRRRNVAGQKIVK